MTQKNDASQSPAPAKRFNARAAAADILRDIYEKGGYSAILLNQRLRALPPDTDERDRRLLTGLVYTALEHEVTIQAVLRRYSSVAPEKLKSYVAACLRLGLAQLMYMDKIPQNAAVNETVELIKHSACRGLSGFVNGVLRGAIRGGFEPLEPANELAKTALRYDMPEWIVKLWQDGYGEETAEQMLRGSVGRKPFCVRVNTLKTTPEALIDRLRQDERVSELARAELVPEAVYLTLSGDPGDWQPYKDGLLTVQDESSMLGPMLLRAESGERVLDICAAPGGKSLYLAARSGDTLAIDAGDLHPHRVELMKENAARLGVNGMNCSVWDGTDKTRFEKEAYDRVLLDVPCSGLGLLRSKPDIKLHRSEAEMAELYELQGKLLETAAAAVKRGGTLLYSTCTLNPAENEKRVEAFLAAHPEFGELDLGARLSESAKTLQFGAENGILANGNLTLLPQKDGRDGFFIALLKKN